MNRLARFFFRLFVPESKAFKSFLQTVSNRRCRREMAKRYRPKPVTPGIITIIRESWHLMLGASDCPKCEGVMIPQIFFSSPEDTTGTKGGEVCSRCQLKR